MPIDRRCEQLQRDVSQPRYGRPNDVLGRKRNIVDVETLSKFPAPVIGAIPLKLPILLGWGPMAEKT